MVALSKIIEQRVRAIIEGRDRGRWPLSRALLGMAAVVYDGVMRLRAGLYLRGILTRRRLPCIVIAIGNLTAGGTGKTPMAIYVAGLLRRLGYTVAVISRGYRGKMENSAAIVGDGHQVLLTAADAGDEPVLMALRLKGVPVLVGRDRIATGMLAVRRFRPDVLVCDDAFQHMRLARDIDLVLLDRANPLGNGRLMPRGMLREPAAALRRADALIMTRADRIPQGHVDHPRRWPAALPVFTARHEPYIVCAIAGQRSACSETAHDSRTPGLERVKGRTAYAFSAIARNRDFRDGLQSAGCLLVGHAEFADHHPFSDQEIEEICRQAHRLGAQMLITTEKDYVRLADRTAWPLDLVVIGIRIVFMDGSADFATFIQSRLGRIRAETGEDL